MFVLGIRLAPDFPLQDNSPIRLRREGGQNDSFFFQTYLNFSKGKELVFQVQFLQLGTHFLRA